MTLGLVKTAGRENTAYTAPQKIIRPKHGINRLAAVRLEMKNGEKKTLLIRTTHYYAGNGLAGSLQRFKGSKDRRLISRFERSMRKYIYKLFPRDAQFDWCGRDELNPVEQFDGSLYIPMIAVEEEFRCKFFPFFKSSVKPSWNLRTGMTEEEYHEQMCAYYNEKAAFYERYAKSLYPAYVQHRRRFPVVLKKLPGLLAEHKFEAAPQDLYQLMYGGEQALTVYNEKKKSVSRRWSAGDYFHWKHFFPYVNKSSYINQFGGGKLLWVCDAGGSGRGIPLNSIGRVFVQEYLCVLDKPIHKLFVDDISQKFNKVPDYEASTMDFVDNLYVWAVQRHSLSEQTNLLRKAA